MFFAEASNEFMGQFLAAILGVGGLIVGIIGLIFAGRRQPPIDAQFTTKAETGELKGEFRGSMTSMRMEIKSDFKDLGEKIDGMSITNERRASDIHGRINEHESRISKLEVQRT